MSETRITPEELRACAKQCQGDVPYEDRWRDAFTRAAAALEAAQQREQAIRALIAELSGETRKYADPPHVIAMQLEAILLNEAPQTTSQERT